MVVGIITLLLFTIVVIIINCLSKREIQMGGGTISISDTTILKGLAIILVVIGHIGQSIPGLRVFTPLGAIGVGIFLICSGYGIEKSFENNGRNKYWYKRIINVWLPYAIVEILTLPLHWKYGWIAILKDFLLIQPLHPFGWYMRFLFLWYILFYVSSFVGKYKVYFLLFASLLLCVITDSLHAQNSFSFTVGVILATNHSTNKIWKTQYLVLCAILGIVFFFVRDYVKNHYHDIHILWNVVSLGYYLSLTMVTVIGYKLLSISKIKLPYKGLAVIGLSSYELYLVHGYAYQILETPASIMMVVLFTLLCIVGAYLLYKLNHIIIRNIHKRFMLHD